MRTARLSAPPGLLGILFLGAFTARSLAVPSDYGIEGPYRADARRDAANVKAPRFQGRPMQVGPLSNMLIAYALGDERVQRWVDLTLDRVSTIAGAKVGPGALHSTIGRHAARAVRCAVFSEIALKHWQLLVDNIGKGDTAIFTPWEYPKGEHKGFGFHVAPRGTLSHWIVIRDGRIYNYQAVVPSTTGTPSTSCEPCAS